MWCSTQHTAQENTTQQQRQLNCKKQAACRVRWWKTVQEYSTYMHSTCMYYVHVHKLYLCVLCACMPIAGMFGGAVRTVRAHAHFGLYLFYMYMFKSCTCMYVLTMHILLHYSTSCRYRSMCTYFIMCKCSRSSVYMTVQYEALMSMKETEFMEKEKKNPWI